VQAEGYPHPEQSGGRSAAEVCTSEARKIGEWLAGARGEAPLSSFCLFYPVGRCGEGGPLRRDSLSLYKPFFSLGVSRGDISLLLRPRREVHSSVSRNPLSR
jgi:hypothetical protein